MQPLTPNRRTGLIVFLLLAGIVAVYWPVWNAGFLSVDDPGYVTDNPAVSAGLSWHGVAWAFTHSHEANYHPLTWLSHMLDCQLFGLSPRWPHVENLLFHVANTLLVFFILRRMTGREGCAAFVAAVFAVHPMHVESVAWVAERKDVLSAFFWLLAMLAYAHYAQQRTWGRYFAVLGLFFLSLLAKPMAVTFPAALLLLDVWPLGRMPWLGAGRSTLPARSEWLPLVREKLPFFGLAAAWCVVTVIAQSAGGAVVSVARMPIGLRVGNATVSYLRYARKFFCPSDLAAFYPFNRPWPAWTVLLAAIALAGITTLAILNWRRRPYVTFGWLWFVGTLVPMIGLVQVGNAAMADRYMYVPMLGLAIAVAWAGADAMPWLWQRRRLTAATAAVALFACGMITSNDVRYWHESEGLFARAIERTEPNVFALYNIGATRMKRGDAAGAAESYAACADLQPTNPHVRRALGAALTELKQYDKAEAQLAISLQYDPNNAETWDAVGKVHVGRNEWPQAAANFAKAVQLQPDRVPSWTNLAVAHRQLNQLEAAMSDLDHALALNPRLPTSWYMRGALLLDAGKPADAAQSFARVAELDPRNSAVRFQLGLALMQAGHGRDAVGPLLAAVQMRPNDPEPLAHLAWLLATHPDQKFRRGDDALFLASRAADLTRQQSPDALDVLAAAQAEKQQFAEAARTADRAANLARAAGNAAMADQIAQRAASYRAGQPVRDGSLAGADAGEVVP